jgi:MFS family permease
MHGLYVLWWVQQKHVSVAAVAAILAAGDLFVTVLELPTGWLADRWGHRASLITGSLLQIAGMLSAWLGEGAPGVLASSLLIAAGDAFRSGADQALLYRSCAAAGDAHFQRREARARALQLVALVGFTLGGGAIVGAWGFAAGWLIETAISVIGLAIACAMAEPPARADEIAEESLSPPSDRLTRPPQSRAARGLGSLLPLIVPAAIVHAMASAGTFFVQSAADRGPAEATILIATVTLAEAAGSCVASQAVAGVRAQLLLAVLGIGTAGATLLTPRAFQPAIVALSFLIGLMFPLRASAIQRAAADGARARAASLASACDKVLATAALLLAGVASRGRSR